MILTTTLGLVLAFEPSERGFMKRRPRSQQAPLLSPFMIWRVVFVWLIFTAGTCGIPEWAEHRGFSTESARTML